MTFKKAAMALVAATSLIAMPTVASAQAASVRSASTVDRAGPSAERENQLGGGSVIIAVLAAAAVIAAIVVAADGDEDAASN